MLLGRNKEVVTYILVVSADTAAGQSYARMDLISSINSPACQMDLLS